MFKEREPFFSLSNNHQCEDFETYNFRNKSDTNYGTGNGEDCHQMRRYVPMSLHSSSCSGDEDMSISPSSSFCGFGVNSAGRSESVFNPAAVGASSMERCGSGGAGGGPQGVRCFGCGHPIVARYYVSAMNSTWHNECLKCHLCHAVLSDEPTCFEKDHKILCKQDYHRLYHETSSKFAKRCARCTNLINSNDLVMKVRDFVYHVDCFVCTICQRTFNRGDHFRMQNTDLRSADLYCRLHYDVIENCNISEESNPPPEPYNSTSKSNSNTNKRGRPPKKKLSSGVPDILKESASSMSYFHPVKPPNLGLSNVGTMSAEFNQIMDSPMNGFNMSSMSHRELPPGISPVGVDGTPNPHQKGKRMRTTFKHNQLRVMKSYFEMNPNPDTKDLKQLSQKTGLCKRVLQVWFQNSRAKSRRGVTGSGQGHRPESSLSGNGVLQFDDSQQDWSPSSPYPGNSQQPTELSNSGSLPLPLVQG
ncbi:LIM/homeobox protein Lhx9 [Folsomia candida]|uniref:LIM/homeobox protein Lhx9 n=1 Tax=Folsomia candida TaxID=158441 RepID=UPI000B8FA047|nr:LIM/homeobox protein Lhx9 [Folsomia candida]